MVEDLCVSCRWDGCPFTKESDLVHELYYLSEKNHKRVERAIEAVKKELWNKGVVMQYDLSLSVSDCQMYKG